MIKADSLLANWTRRIDWPLMAAVAVLMAIGLVAVFSAVSPSSNPMKFMTKQVAAMGLGLAAVVVLTTLNYQIFRSYPWVIYGASIVLLILVLLIGKTINGAKSWIVLGPVSFEPLEVARVWFILTVAAVLDRPERETQSVRWLFWVGLIGLVQVVLLLLQPCLGDTLVYAPIILAMLYFAGMPPLYLLAVAIFGGVAAGLPVISTYFSLQPQLLQSHPIVTFLVGSASQVRTALELLVIVMSLIFGAWWFLRKLRFRLPWQYPAILSVIMALGIGAAHLVESHIKDYQRKRIVVFLSPGFDPLGAGYNILQSEIAIGSGGLFGKGLFSGTQTQLGFLPEKHTDFIFSVIGEELGFFWASTVLACLGVVVWRCWVIATRTQDRFGSLVAVGLGTLFGFQSLMNVGMVLGLLPVTGVALPFVSYGGTHLLTALVCVGILQSINFRRYIY